MSSDDPRVPTASDPNDRAQWERDKIEFGRRFLTHTEEFLKLDNRLVSQLVEITQSLNEYAKVHPDRVFAVEGSAGIGAKLSPDDLAGGAGGDLLDFIKDVVLADKDLIRDIVKSLLRI